MWDETPGRPAGDATPNPNATPRIWDATPGTIYLNDLMDAELKILLGGFKNHRFPNIYAA